MQKKNVRRPQTYTDRIGLNMNGYINSENKKNNG